MKSLYEFGKQYRNTDVSLNEVVDNAKMQLILQLIEDCPFIELLSDEPKRKLATAMYVYSEGFKSKKTRSVKLIMLCGAIKLAVEAKEPCEWYYAYLKNAEFTQDEIIAITTSLTKGLKEIKEGYFG